ncbi:hypothetical protein LCGC14_1329870 [marine sediment metagenome]|uniref:Methyltransferase type 11 domain-containing protein n=1 Tax=marine sediment metagenome TaxID=412755 RepID=A0A0F9KHL6_9ZZZZ
MGISIHNWTLLQKALNYFGKDLSNIAMCELGNQRIRHPERMSITALTGKEYFQTLGMKHSSIDQNGRDGSLQYDLNEPIVDSSLINQFDIITNFGTSEHVTNQYQCFRNIHNLCKKEGLFVHCVPMKGSWQNDGVHSCRYRYSTMFFTRLASIYNYEILCNEIIIQKKNKSNLLENQSLVGVIMSKSSDCSFDQIVFNLEDIDDEEHS